MTDAAAQREPGGARSRLHEATGTLWTSVGSAIAIVAAGIALAFSLWPSLTPDPRTKLAATIKVVGVETGVRYDDYLRRIFREKPPQELAGATGTVVNLRVNVAGRKHSGLRLYQYLHGLSDGRRLPDQPAADALDSGFEADTPDDQWIQPVWVTFAGYEDVFARLELYDRQTMLAVVDTKDLAQAP